MRRSEFLSNVRIASVCAMNNNRSMACHAFLQQQGINVTSYGTSVKVKLPGASQEEINEFDFGTPYSEMMRVLSEKDHDLYTSNGLLNKLEQNSQIKLCPERFQDTDFWRHPEIIADIIICFEIKVYEAVIEDLNKRGNVFMRPVHVVNFETKDTFIDANLGGVRVRDFIIRLDNTFGHEKHAAWEHFLQENIEQVLQNYELEVDGVDDLRHQLLYY